MEQRNTQKLAQDKNANLTLMNYSHKVFLVDGDSSVRRALTRLIKSAGYDVQAFASARDFLECRRVTDEQLGCLVLDVRMPGLSGLDLQHELQATNTLLPIIFVTGHGDIPMSVKAIKDGAVDFLPKPYEPEELEARVIDALEADERALAQRKHLAELRDRYVGLTPREREVFAAVATGMLNKQVAAEYGISEKTVKVHRARVMEKMGAATLPELVRMADSLMPKDSTPVASLMH
jgi:FixJ family two-component response regulator